ncbi:bacterioferritin-associated ferredoxin [Nissabacter sp. SGAir0207]|uniref:bacterioferritin-associated ferredoxin n=1 Tax=Nissabacter sp. SGAir0207 TaxID=2126321 RepID=UPI0010CCB8C6|nr:bacterioferritin-associated ferredoxin [Nissabacter sp. SGAir0207]QCR34810.1 bacterioferritin-associated ferredoxin [Nissabacter sp. SGAir0207]
MYVCLCNAVSDKTIRQAVRRYQPRTFQQLKTLVPVGTQCGKCVRVARQIMEDELQSIPEFENIA